MKKVIQLFAYIDLLLGISLALPYWGIFLIQLLHTLVSDDGLIIDAYHALLMKILGAMVILWAAVRIRQPELWQIHYDCITRLFVLSFMIFYCCEGLTVILFFIFVELLGLYYTNGLP